eukprot:scaffold32603_cov68-Cyclotella_meneghiniana.AAC.5
MSISSLITQRLPSLRLAPRAIGQLLPQNLTAAVTATATHQTTSRAVSSQPMLPVISSSSPLIQRQFSSMNAQSNDDDDGGSLTSNVSSMTNSELADMQSIPGWNLVHNPPRRHTPRGALVGTVVSDKMQKTVNVAVDRYRIVPKYRKRMRFTRKFMAHDEFEGDPEAKGSVVANACNKQYLLNITSAKTHRQGLDYYIRYVI